MWNFICTLALDPTDVRCRLQRRTCYRESQIIECQSGIVKINIVQSSHFTEKENYTL